MHVENCECLLLSISREVNGDQSLFVVDLNERRRDSANLEWSIIIAICAVYSTVPTWIASSSKRLLFLTRWLNSLHGSFFPHLVVSLHSCIR